MMKIERVELILVELPYVHFFETSLGREESKVCILVKAYSEGICGYGEVVADKLPLYSYETNATAWIMLKEIFIPLVFKKGVIEPEDFSTEARRYKGHPMARAGMELALWDLKAKKAGLPLFEMYGGTKKEVLSGVSVGIQDSVAELLARIASFLEEGYPRVKIKIKPGWDTHICRAVRERFPDLPLQTDANAAYVIGDKQTLKALDDFDLLMLEQPFSGEDLWDHSLLQREMKTPLCLDESAKSADIVGKAIDMKSCQVINIKVGRVGGIVEARKIHDLCQERGIPVWCGGMLETGIGRAHNLHFASLPNFTLTNDISASRRYYAEDLIDPPVSVTKAGTIKIPDGKGIGVSVQEGRITRAAQRKEVFEL
jgi:O-succinylbenzoate synthase